MFGPPCRWARTRGLRSGRFTSRIRGRALAPERFWSSSWRLAITSHRSLVGGTTGTFISNRIAHHISSSLNWGLAAALGVILLGIVITLYLLYEKIVGIDNLKLG